LKNQNWGPDSSKVREREIKKIKKKFSKIGLEPCNSGARDLLQRVEIRKIKTLKRNKKKRKKKRKKK